MMAPADLNGGRPKRQRVSMNGTATPTGSSSSSSSSSSASKAKKTDEPQEVNSIKKVVELYVTKDFIDKYKKSNGDERWKMLINIYDDIWEHLEQHGGKNVAFSVSVAARIREALGPSLAPENVSGSPALPIPRGFTCFYKGQLAVVGLHSQPGTGINSSNGTATAIVVNGGYADDVDRGSLFIYVGEGGEETGQSQKLSRGNHALLAACQNGLAIRVIRGYRAHSRFAPPWGFRYDGLYKIVTAYNDIGQQDRRVWKFVFQSVDQTFVPPSCGCSETHVINHMMEDPEDKLFPPEFVPKTNWKLISGVEEHSKKHTKAQSEDFNEPKRMVTVIVPGRDISSNKTSYRIRVSQFIMVDDLNQSMSPQKRHKLPTFKKFLTPLKAFGDEQWINSIYSLYTLPDSNPSKPLWAKYKFLPYTVKLTTQINGTKETISLAINYELGKEYALQYFPQSIKDGVKAEIVLNPPFDEKFDPWKDVSQGMEEYPIQCYNEVDDTLPPTDFTYIRRSVAFFDCSAELTHVCSGCIPKDVDTSKWIEVPKNGNRCAGLKDPLTDRIYCYGQNIHDAVVIGDCNGRCPCTAQLCTNRRWKDGVQFKVSVRRRVGVGWAVFAEEQIPQGSFIMEYAGDIIHFGELMARVHKYEANGKHNYCFSIYEDEGADASSHEMPCLDSLYFGNVSRFINHSCDPNCAPHPHHHSGNDGRGLSLISLREIQPGEELCYDYGPWYTDGMECLCLSSRCRGFVRRDKADNAVSSSDEDKEQKKKQRKLQ